MCTTHFSNASFKKKLTSFATKYPLLNPQTEKTPHFCKTFSCSKNRSVMTFVVSNWSGYCISFINFHSPSWLMLIYTAKYTTHYESYSLYHHKKWYLIRIAFFCVCSLLHIPVQNWSKHFFKLNQEPTAIQGGQTSSTSAESIAASKNKINK